MLISAQSLKKYEKFERYQDIVYVLEMRRPETDKMSSHVVSGTLVAYGGYTDRVPPNLKPSYSKNFMNSLKVAKIIKTKRTKQDV